MSARMAGLGDPPEFLRDGSWPPVESDPVLLATGFRFVEGGGEAMNALVANDSDDLPEDLQDARRYALLWDLSLQKGDWPFHGYRELRRISYMSHWRREDPVSQLAPGTSFQKTVRFETGLTTSESEELLRSLEASESQGLSGSLGAKVPIGWAEVGAKLGASINRNLEAKLSQYLNRSITITSKSFLETIVALTNDSASGTYRRFALWHPVETMSVDVLDIAFLGTLCWMPLSRASFAAPSSSINMTSWPPERDSSGR